MTRRAIARVRGPAGLLGLGACLTAGAFLLAGSIGPTGARAGMAEAGITAPYNSCRDAFQDGRANMLRGEPGYRADLDADGDGKACEPYTPSDR